MSLAEEDLAAVTEDEKKKIEDEKRRIEASRGIKRKRNPSVDNKKIISANSGFSIKAKNVPGVAITETSKARFQIDSLSSDSYWLMVKNPSYWLSARGPTHCCVGVIENL